MWPKQGWAMGPGSHGTAVLGRQSRPWDWDRDWCPWDAWDWDRFLWDVPGLGICVRLVSQWVPNRGRPENIQPEHKRSAIIFLVASKNKLNMKFFCFFFRKKIWISWYKLFVAFSEGQKNVNKNRDGVYSPEIIFEGKFSNLHAKNNFFLIQLIFSLKIGKKTLGLKVLLVGKTF